MKLQVLGSSSRGNCYLIETNKNERLMLDAGVNFKTVQQELNFDLKRNTRDTSYSRTHGSSKICYKFCFKWNKRVCI